MSPEKKISVIKRRAGVAAAKLIPPLEARRTDLLKEKKSIECTINYLETLIALGKRADK